MKSSRLTAKTETPTDSADDISGNSAVLISPTRIPVTDDRRRMLRAKLNISLMKITAIYPSRPRSGTRSQTAMTLIKASAILTYMVYTCSPMPFSAESTAVSRYMTGMSGASTLMHLPA